MKAFSFLGVLFVCSHVVLAIMPTVVLKNTAVGGVTLPAIGLGTGAYGMENEAYGTYPECADEPHKTGPPPPGCGENTVRMVLSWLRLGGRRLDCANSYYNQKSVGKAIALSGVPRKEIFILSKVGPTLPLGYNDTLSQFEDVLADLNVSYVDALLIHWPGPHPGGTDEGVSTDPLCNESSTLYNAKECRITTWKAMLQIFHSGRARSIGVSNYNETHLQELIDAGLPLPAINQCHFHPYSYALQRNVMQFCQQHQITFLAYAPLGTPDAHKFPGPQMSPTVLTDPVVVRMAKKYNVTPAQFILNWAWSQGVPSNPRTQSEPHMLENLNALNFEIDMSDRDQMYSLPQDTCAVDPTWYQCA